MILTFNYYALPAITCERHSVLRLYKNKRMRAFIRDHMLKAC